jgi:hypothetical protein
MTVTIFGAVITKLNGDTTLATTYAIPFFRARTIKPADLPCGTLLVNNEKSSPRVGYNTTAKIRDNEPTIQIDLWCSAQSETFPCSGEDLDLVADRVDAVLLDSTSSVSGSKEGTWRKTTSSQQLENDTGIWHNALRYTFQYSTTDT